MGVLTKAAILVLDDQPLELARLGIARPGTETDFPPTDPGAARRRSVARSGRR